MILQKGDITFVNKPYQFSLSGTHHAVALIRQSSANDMRTILVDKGPN